MRKLFSNRAVYLTLITLLCLAFSLLKNHPIATQAADTGIDLLPYFLGDGNPGDATFSNDGQVFYEYKMPVNGNPNGFYIIKSRNQSVYEEFTYDDSYIYHLKDTSWADGSGDIFCTNGNPAGFTMSNGTGSSSSIGTAQEGIQWAPRHMTVGETFHSDTTIIAFDKTKCVPCEANYTGNTGRVFKFEALYTSSNPFTLPSGIQVTDGIKLTITDGPGKGESFWYDKAHGWVAFGREGTPTAYAVSFSSAPTISLKADPKNGGSFACQPFDGFYGESGPGKLLATFGQQMCTTGEQEADKFTSRPAPCATCLDYVPEPVRACASNFTYEKTLKYTSFNTMTCDNKQCSVDLKDCSIQLGDTDVADLTDVPQLLVGPIPWQGRFVLNASTVKQPYVGNDTEESREKYIADYVDGTTYYNSTIDPGTSAPTDDRDPADIFDPNVDVYYQMPPKDPRFISYSGIVPKLASQEYIDKLKYSLLDRVQANGTSITVMADILPVRDYTIGYTWGSGDTTSLSLITSDKRRPLRSNFTTAADYLSAIKSWETLDGGKWFRLWSYVPIASREDSPGQFHPIAQQPAAIVPVTTGGGGNVGHPPGQPPDTTPATPTPTTAPTSPTYPNKYNCSAYVLPSAAPTPPSDNRLKIMTFNVQFAESHDNLPTTHATKLAENDAQMRSIAQAIKANSLDVVTLQEMDRYSLEFNSEGEHPRFTCIKDVSSACCQPSVSTFNSLDPLMEELKNIDYPMYFAVGNYSPDDNSYKNQPYFVTLSRYPIVYFMTYHKGDRDPLISVIQVGSKYLRVVNIHSRGPHEDGRPDDSPRQAYFLELSGAINDNIKNSVGYVAGDFNSPVETVLNNFPGFTIETAYENNTRDFILYPTSDPNPYKLSFTKFTPVPTPTIILEEGYSTDGHKPIFGTLDITNLPGETPTPTPTPPPSTPSTRKYNCSTYAIPASAPTPPTNNLLKVMTFNVQFTRFASTPPSVTDSNIAQMKSIANAIKANNLDIVTLQEMDRYNTSGSSFTCTKDGSSACCDPSTTFNNLDYLMAELKNINYPMYFSVGDYSTNDNYYGNYQPYFVTLSRYPISYDMSYTDGDDSRQPLISVINIGTKYLRVVNVHSRDAEPYLKDAYELSLNSSNTSINNSAGIVAGDFNARLGNLANVFGANFTITTANNSSTTDSIVSPLNFNKTIPLSSPKVIEQEPGSHTPLFGTLDITNLPTAISLKTNSSKLFSKKNSPDPHANSFASSTLFSPQSTFLAQATFDLKEGVDGDHAYQPFPPDPDNSVQPAPEPVTLQLPHVARLYESASTLYDLLSPYAQKKTISPSPPPTGPTPPPISPPPPGANIWVYAQNDQDTLFKGTVSAGSETHPLLFQTIKLGDRDNRKTETTVIRLASRADMNFSITFPYTPNINVLMSPTGEVPSTRSGNTITFNLPSTPGNYVLKTNYTNKPIQALAIFIDDYNTVPREKPAGAFAFTPDQSTDSIQNAINSANPNTSFYFGPGTYNLSSLKISSKNDLHFILHPEAILNQTSNRDQFIIINNGSKNITFTGPGQIITPTGNGETVFPVDSSNQITLADFLIHKKRLGDGWTLHLNKSNTVTVNKVRIFSGNDGTDPDSSSNVTYDSVYIESQDDAVAVKTRNKSLSVENLLFTNGFAKSAASALKIGKSSVLATINNVTFQNSTVYDSDRSLVVDPEDNGKVHAVTFSNLNIRFIKQNEDGYTIQVTKGEDNFDASTRIHFDNLKAEVIKANLIEHHVNISNSVFTLTNNTNVFSGGDCGRISLNSVTLNSNGYSGNLGCSTSAIPSSSLFTQKITPNPLNTSMASSQLFSPTSTIQTSNPRLLAQSGTALPLGCYPTDPNPPDGRTDSPGCFDVTLQLDPQISGNTLNYCVSVKQTCSLITGYIGDCYWQFNGASTPMVKSVSPEGTTICSTYNHGGALAPENASIGTSGVISGSVRCNRDININYCPQTQSVSCSYVVNPDGSVTSSCQNTGGPGTTPAPICAPTTLGSVPNCSGTVRTGAGDFLCGIQTYDLIISQPDERFWNQNTSSSIAIDEDGDEKSPADGSHDEDDFANSAAPYACGAAVACEDGGCTCDLSVNKYVEVNCRPLFDDLGNPIGEDCDRKCCAQSSGSGACDSPVNAAPNICSDDEAPNCGTQNAPKCVAKPFGSDSNIVGSRDLPDQELTYLATREIHVATNLPYLGQIYKKLIGFPEGSTQFDPNNTPVYRMFTPYRGSDTAPDTVPWYSFHAGDASGWMSISNKGSLENTAISNSQFSSAQDINQPFYFPYLGAIQDATQFVRDCLTAGFPNGCTSSDVKDFYQGKACTVQFSKLSFFANQVDDDLIEFINKYKPAVIKVMGPALTQVDQLKAANPTTQILARAYNEKWESIPSGYKIDDLSSADQAAQDWLNDTTLVPNVDYWEGINEPVIGTGTEGQARMKWLAHFEAKRLELLDDEGTTGCIGNFATGNPDNGQTASDYGMWPYFQEAFDAATKYDATICLHEYATATTTVDYNRMGRYEKMYSYLASTANADDDKLQTIISETGATGTGSADSGWKTVFNNDIEKYLTSMKEYDQLLQGNPKIIGGTLFIYQHPNWPYQAQSPEVIQALLAGKTSGNEALSCVAKNGNTPGWDNLPPTSGGGSCFTYHSLATLNNSYQDHGHVDAGDAVAIMGQTGYPNCATGPHVHFVYSKEDGTILNPHQVFTNSIPVNNPYVRQDFGITDYSRTRYLNWCTVEENGRRVGYHEGLDLTSNVGDHTLRTPKEGELYRGRMACSGSSDILIVAVRHPDGTITWYYHVNYGYSSASSDPVPYIDTASLPPSLVSHLCSS